MSGRILTRVEAAKLPEGSRIQRVDLPVGRSVPYAPLQKYRGLWVGDAPSTFVGGIGTADWLVIRVGDSR